MGKKKEEIEAEKKREIVRQLRKGPDLEQYVEGKKRKFTTYARGASLYSMNYYSFVNLAKEAGARISLLSGKQSVRNRRVNLRNIGGRQRAVIISI